MNTDYYAMIFKRKSFHLFRTTENISQIELDALNDFFGTVKPLDPDIKTKTVIVPHGETSCRCGAEYCILFYSEKKNDYLRNIGYIGEQIDLYCASRNIGAVWFGFGKTPEERKDGLDFVIMMAISKVPQDRFRKEMFKARRKPLEELWSGDTFGVGEIARFSPSACNSQPWTVENTGDLLRVYRRRKQGKVGIMPPDKADYFNRIDIGIYLFILETCLTHEGYSFDRKTFADGSDSEKILSAEYEIKKND